MLTAAQHAEIIKTHWKLLWPLPHRERLRVLDQLLADAEFEEQLRCVSEIMSCVSTSSITSEVSSSPSRSAF